MQGARQETAQPNRGIAKSDGWGDKTAKQLSQWDPYDQNASAPFFDPEWMFGVREGFDVVIGNPPYGRILTESHEKVVGERFPIFLRTKDAYVAFTLMGLALARDGGCLSFIEPAAWLGGPSYVAFRTYLLGRSICQLVLLPFDMFAAAYVDTLILLVRNTTANNTHTVRAFAYPKRTQVADFAPGPWELIRPIEWTQQPDKKFILSRDLIAVTAKLREHCSLNFADVLKMKRGVLFDHKLLTEKKTTQDSHPYFEGDVYRYELNYAAPSWVEYGCMMREYPKEFCWFEGARILLRRLVSRKQRLMATLVRATFITNKNLYTVLPKPGTLPLEVSLALLNSSLVSRLYISAVSQAVKDDFPQVTIADVLALPVPTRIDGKDQDLLAALVSRILAAKAADPVADTTALEREIDEIVYRLYGLTEEEIAIVEGTTGKGEK